MECKACSVHPPFFSDLMNIFCKFIILFNFFALQEVRRKEEAAARGHSHCLFIALIWCLDSNPKLIYVIFCASDRSDNLVVFTNKMSPTVCKSLVEIEKKLVNFHIYSRIIISLFNTFITFTKCFLKCFHLV